VLENVVYKKRSSTGIGLASNDNEMYLAFTFLMRIFEHSMMVNARLIWVALMLSGNVLWAQGCADALSNYVCADEAEQVDSLQAEPYFNACIFNQVPTNSLSYTSWYSFHTNTIADVGSVDIAIDFVDCDFSTDGANDFIYVSVFPLQPGEDPCDAFASIAAECAGSDQSFTFSPSAELLPDTDYLVVVGSNHEPQGGNLVDPCAFDVTISGSALGIVASINPLSVALGESAFLLVEGADNDYPVQWTPGQYLDDPTSLSPEVYAEETTSFQVSGQVGNCPATDVVSLTIGSPIEIFTAFSPNGDGINDVWNIGEIERFPTCQIEVFDRWGQSLFKSVGYEQPWDGTYKGKYLPTGAYYYVVELNSLDVTIPPMTGVVSIVH
jgi:gliding motility-associated-like protein